VNVEDYPVLTFVAFVAVLLWRGLLLPITLAREVWRRAFAVEIIAARRR
jgi:hypothetical protein